MIYRCVYKIENWNQNLLCKKFKRNTGRKCKALETNNNQGTAQSGRGQ